VAAGDRDGPDVKVTLLGTGGAGVDERRHECCTLVSIGDERILVDAGRGAAVQLHRAGVDVARVNPILLTHHHLDHVAELATLVRLSRSRAEVPLRVMGPTGTEAMIGELLEGPFARSFAADRAYDRWRGAGRSPREVEAQDMGDGSVLDFGSWTLRAREVEHGQQLLGIADWWHCLGYRFEAEGKSVVVSGDSAYTPALAELARNADVLVQACPWADSELVDERDALEAEGFFASAGVAGRIAAEARVGTLVLTHIGSQACTDEMKADAGRRYDGPIVVGEDLLEIAL
jgi:ribonuclease Z